jgi:hypothetical protein
MGAFQAGTVQNLFKIIPNESNIPFTIWIIDLTAMPQITDRANFRLGLKMAFSSKLRPNNREAYSR